MESRESIDLDFSRYLLTIKRRWLPAVTIFAITVTSAVFATRFLKQSYQAEGKLLFKVDRTSVLTGVGGGTEELRPLVSTQNPLSTEIEVVYSKPLLQNTIDAIGLKNKKNQPVTPEDIKRKLTVKIIGGTDVLRIAYESSTAEEAATVVNKVMSLYIQKNILTNRAEAAAAREFIAQQLPKTEAAVRKVEASLREFKEKNNVVSLPEEAKTAVAAIAALDSQITTLRAQLQETVARSAALGNTVGLSAQEAIAVSALSQSPAVQGVLKELQAVETQLANQRSIYREESPTIASLKDKETILKVLLQQQIQQVVGSQIQIPERLLQIGDLKQNLIKDFLAAEVQRLSLAKQLASLSSSQTAYQKRVNILPKLEQDQRDLERKLEAAQSTYATLLKKMQEAQVAENQNTGNARIIEEATVPEKPESGSKAKIIALGVLLGALFSTTTILLLEISDKSIKTLKEVRELFGYPLIGIIPSFGKKIASCSRKAKTTTIEIPVVDAPYSLVSEIYRMIQANLKSLSSDKQLKIIVVTSSVPKEGKSTVSANLAAAMAQLGRRILLIDADMRHPCQHHVWKLSNALGLSDVLGGGTKSWTAVCEVMDNLDVLPAGVMPPHPLALLDSTCMVSLIKDFSDKYDFVIIDAPALMIAADALTLGQMTDGILLVARPGVVDSASLISAKEMIHPSAQNILGLVVNGVMEKSKFK